MLFKPARFDATPVPASFAQLRWRTVAAQATTRACLAAAVHTACLPAFAGAADPLSAPQSAQYTGIVGSAAQADAMDDDRPFHDVPLGTTERTACSPPEPDFEWRGVVLRAPARVTLTAATARSRELVIPLCGLYTVDLAMALRHPGRLALVVTDITTGASYRGELVDRDPSPIIPPPRTLRAPRPDPERLAKMASASNFNVDAAAYVTLPALPARYRIRAEFAGYRSNEVDVEVLPRP